MVCERDRRNRIDRRGISGSAAVAKAAPQGRPFPHPSGAESSEITQLATAAVQDEWCQLLIVARRQRLLTSWEHRRALASDKERCMQCDVGLLGLQTALTALHQPKTSRKSSENKRRRNRRQELKDKEDEDSEARRKLADLRDKESRKRLKAKADDGKRLQQELDKVEKEPEPGDGGRYEKARAGEEGRLAKAPRVRGGQGGGGDRWGVEGLLGRGASGDGAGGGATPAANGSDCCCSIQQKLRSSGLRKMDFVSETLVALAEILAAAAEDLPRDGSPSFPVLKFQLQELSEYLGEVTRPPHRR
eukprot:s484_g10.t3